MHWITNLIKYILVQDFSLGLFTPMIGLDRVTNREIPRLIMDSALMNSWSLILLRIMEI